MPSQVLSSGALGEHSQLSASRLQLLPSLQLSCPPQLPAVHWSPTVQLTASSQLVPSGAATNAYFDLEPHLDEYRRIGAIRARM